MWAVVDFSRGIKSALTVPYKLPTLCTNVVRLKYEYLVETTGGGLNGAPLLSSLQTAKEPEKPDSQHSDKIKEDEVSSSEEAFKTNSSVVNSTEEGKSD